MQAGGPPPWFGNAGGASVLQGICLVRTSAMHLQGYRGESFLRGPMATPRRAAPES
jgi:hypothetical protein